MCLVELMASESVSTPNLLFLHDDSLSLCTHSAEKLGFTIVLSQNDTNSVRVSGNKNNVS